MNDKLDALDRLAKLKADGAITEAEFSEEKRKVLEAESSATPTAQLTADKGSIPWYRRPLFMIVCGLLCVPLELLIMWTGPSYFRVKGGGYTRMGKGMKTFLSILGVGYMLFGLAAVLSDGSQSNRAVSAADTTASSQSSEPSAPSSPKPSDTPAPPASDSGSSPDMQVQVTQEEGHFNKDVTITSDDDQPFTVRRVVANGRAGEEGCDSDLKYEKEVQIFVPARLKRGDAAPFYPICGNAILTVDVYTDRGNASFKIESDNK